MLAPGLSLSPVPSVVTLVYDSIWAAAVSRAIWLGRKIKKQVEQARRSVEAVRDAGITIVWAHARSHQGHFLNELADHAALIGLAASTTTTFTVHQFTDLLIRQQQPILARHLQFHQQQQQQQQQPPHPDASPPPAAAAAAAGG